MNKNLKIITINGFRGMLMAVFVVLGLIAGFIISPGWVCMKLWNYFAVDFSFYIPMNIFQGIMLWGVIALSLYAINNKKSLIGFGSYPVLSKEQIKDIMKKTKISDASILSDLENFQSDIAENEDISKETDNESEKKEEIRG